VTWRVDQDQLESAQRTAATRVTTAKAAKNESDKSNSICQFPAITGLVGIGNNSPPGGGSYPKGPWRSKRPPCLITFL